MLLINISCTLLRINSTNASHYQLYFLPALNNSWLLATATNYDNRFGKSILEFGRQWASIFHLTLSLLFWQLMWHRAQKLPNQSVQSVYLPSIQLILQMVSKPTGVAVKISKPTHLQLVWEVPSYVKQTVTKGIMTRVWAHMWENIPGLSYS